MAGSGYPAVYYGAFCLFLGVPVYIWMKTARGEYGESVVIPAGLESPSPALVDLATVLAEPARPRVRS